MPYRMTNKSFYAEPITKPENVIQHLAKRERHWRKGYSGHDRWHTCG